MLSGNYFDDKLRKLYSFHESKPEISQNKIFSYDDYVAINESNQIASPYFPRFTRNYLAPLPKPSDTLKKRILPVSNYIKITKKFF